MLNRIILLALSQEAPVLSQRPDVFITGVGKVNAAMITAQLILRHRPHEIINFGTAGGVTVSSGLHRCTRFLQRDMDCRALGFAPGQVPFDAHSVIQFGSDGLTCGTGDNFVHGSQPAMPVDIVDMEAYAMARVCVEFGVNFQCWKYITDNANEQAATDWQHNVSVGESLYLAKLQQLS